MVLSLYLRRESSDFDEIWCAGSNFGSKKGQLLIYKKIMKFKMADSPHIESRLLALSPRVIVRLTPYLVCTSIIMLRLTPRDENSNFKNSRWRTAAILKMVSSLYLSRGPSHFNEIWCDAADFGSKDGYWQSIKILQIQNNGRPPYWKSFLAISQRLYD